MNGQDGMKKSLLGQFQSQLLQSYSKTAVCTEQKSLTYGQLNALAIRFFQEIRRYQLGPDPLIAIYAQRSPEIVAAMLGIMANGAAYTVVEAHGNFEEHLLRLEQIKPDLVLIDTPEDKASPNGERLSDALSRRGISCLQFPKEMPPLANGSETQELPLPSESATAYVLYTSGSTGVPKGVAISHANIAHYCSSLVARLGLPDGLTYAHVSTFAADLGNTSLFLSLWTGGTLYLAGEEIRKDPSALAKALVSQGVDVLKITPTHWTPILSICEQQRRTDPMLKYLILGGEPLQTEIARRCLQRGICSHLVNHYGPTETTVGVVVHALSLESLDKGEALTQPIGRPFGETQILIETPDGQHVHRGEGELLIGGPSVAIGYRNMEEATHSKFVLLQGQPGRFYRTGDLVSTDEDGNLRFLGRLDRQVKVNGYRVELEHVERVLRDIPGIQRATVILHRHQHHDYLLCAFDGEAEANGDLRRTVAGRLPGHMVPYRLEKLSPFPMNANGKTDLPLIKNQLVSRFNEKFLQPPSATVSSGGILGDLQEAFARCLGQTGFKQESNFFDLGGDSLDAIMVIMELQLKGYPVTAHGFLTNPTIGGLMQMITAARSQASIPGKAPPGKNESGNWPLAPAQRWFFRQSLEQSDNWTQAIALECGMSLDAAVLESALARVVGEHPMLTARFEGASEKGVLTANPQSQPVLTIYHPQADEISSPENLEKLIRTRYSALEAQLNITSGVLFKAELLQCPGEPDRLLLVAHHLVVDVVSWRILLDDMMRHYAVLQGKEAPATPAPSTSFGHWVQHLQDSRQSLQEGLAFWQQQPWPKPAPSIDYGLESESRTAWLSFSVEQTQELSKRAVSFAEMPLDRLILAAFLYQYGLLQRQDNVQVDIESHGRLSLQPDVDVSRTVGWFTSIYPLAFDLRHFPEELHQQVDESLGKVPHLGLGYALLGESLGNDIPPSPICFNFLGQIRLGLRNDWNLRPLVADLGNLRGARNKRSYDLKLTGRIVDQKLVLDLNYPDKLYQESSIRHFMHGLLAQLAARLGIPIGNIGGQLSVSHNNSSGMLWNVPGSAFMAPSSSGVRRYEQILLTGANGFLGIHILHQLLARTSGKIICLVRASNGRDPETRLRESWANFFPLEDYLYHRYRLVIANADIRSPGLGLEPETWQRYSQGVDAIYHFAADTRLIGDEDAAEAAILFPVQEVIRLAETGKAKDLHFMSTLAVCGVCEGGSPASFDEHSLDIGQKFLNGYERAKFHAEKAIRAFAYRGGATYIYRSGNITGNSRSGAFQINAASNRWIQCLQATLALGRYPARDNEEIVLSPVDVVARGIVAISLNPLLQGGTYHVDSSHAVPMPKVYAALQKLGADLEEVEGESLAELFLHSGRLNENEIALGYFWSSRPARNVCFNHEATLALLARQQIFFPPLSNSWIERFLAHILKQQGLKLPNRKLPATPQEA